MIKRTLTAFLLFFTVSFSTCSAKKSLLDYVLRPGLKTTALGGAGLVAASLYLTHILGEEGEIEEDIGSESLHLFRLQESDTQQRSLDVAMSGLAIAQYRRRLATLARRKRRMQILIGLLSLLTAAGVYANQNKAPGAVNEDPSDPVPPVSEGAQRPSSPPHTFPSPPPTPSSSLLATGGQSLSDGLPVGARRSDGLYVGPDGTVSLFPISELPYEGGRYSGRPVTARRVRRVPVRRNVTVVGPEHVITVDDFTRMREEAMAEGEAAEQSLRQDFFALLGGADVEGLSVPGDLPGNEADIEGGRRDGTGQGVDWSGVRLAAAGVADSDGAREFMKKYGDYREGEAIDAETLLKTYRMAFTDIKPEAFFREKVAGKFVVVDEAAYKLLGNRGGGDCGYRSLAQCMGEDEEEHPKWRHNICDAHVAKIAGDPGYKAMLEAASLVRAVPEKVARTAREKYQDLNKKFSSICATKAEKEQRYEARFAKRYEKIARKRAERRAWKAEQLKRFGQVLPPLDEKKEQAEIRDRTDHYMRANDRYRKSKDAWLERGRGAIRRYVVNHQYAGDADAYIERMRRQGVYAEGAEMERFAERVRQPVLAFVDPDNAQYRVYDYEGPKVFDASRIRVYGGQYRGDPHLLRNSGTLRGEPPKAGDEKKDKRVFSGHHWEAYRRLVQESDPEVLGDEGSGSGADREEDMGGEEA